MSLFQHGGMYGYRGVGQSGETDVEGSGFDFGGSVSDSSGEIDLVGQGAQGPALPGSDAGTWEGWEGMSDATPEEQAAAAAWELQNVPVEARGGSAAEIAALSKLALTSAQIAAGLTAGTVVASPTCGSGYKFSTGVCVSKPTTSPSGTSGQWVSFATNQQVVTFGLIVVGTLVLVNLIPSGGRRR